VVWNDDPSRKRISCLRSVRPSSITHYTFILHMETSFRYSSSSTNNKYYLLPVRFSSSFLGDVIRIRISDKTDDLNDEIATTTRV
jgi:hypothetical protein